MALQQCRFQELPSIDEAVQWCFNHSDASYVESALLRLYALALPAKEHLDKQQMRADERDSTVRTPANHARK